jgi:heat shock protein HslJ
MTATGSSGLTEDGFAAGSTGCNSFRGKVERSGTRVKFGPLATTRMACLNPDLAGQEQRMLRVLQSADRMALAGERLTLHAGPRPLARFGIVYLR